MNCEQPCPQRCSALSTSASVREGWDCQGSPTWLGRRMLVRECPSVCERARAREKEARTEGGRERGGRERERERERLRETELNLFCRVWAGERWCRWCAGPLVLVYPSAQSPLMCLDVASGCCVCIRRTWRRLCATRVHTPTLAHSWCSLQ